MHWHWQVAGDLRRSWWWWWQRRERQSTLLQPNITRKSAQLEQWVSTWLASPVRSSASSPAPALRNESTPWIQSETTITSLGRGLSLSVTSAFTLIKQANAFDWNTTVESINWCHHKFDIKIETRSRLVRLIKRWLLHRRWNHSEFQFPICHIR